MQTIGAVLMQNTIPAGFLNIHLFGKRNDMASKNRATEKTEGLKQLLSGSAAVVNDPEAEADMKTTSGLSRMVDMRIPLWGILSAVGALGILLINMWLSVQQLTVAMVEVQATLKGGNSQATSSMLEIERLKSRLDRAEETYRDLQAQLMQQQFRQQRTAP